MELKEVVTLSVYMIVAAAFFFLLFVPIKKDPARERVATPKIRTVMAIVCLVAILAATFGTTLL